VPVPLQAQCLIHGEGLPHRGLRRGRHCGRILLGQRGHGGRWSG
jgi:hypothetical protein